VPLTRDESDELAEWAQECHAAQGLGMLPVERREDEAELDDAHGIRFQAVIHKITADEWQRRPERPACPCGSTRAGVAAGTSASD
jgi:hypothetical protein